MIERAQRKRAEWHVRPHQRRRDRADRSVSTTGQHDVKPLVPRGLCDLCQFFSGHVPDVRIELMCFQNLADARRFVLCRRLFQRAGG